jgi:ABC-type ATPase involved in cell division
MGSCGRWRALTCGSGHGEIFALLGPNGAGKTSTVEIIEGYRQRDGGEVRVLGLDPGRQGRLLKQQIGIVLQSTGVDPYLTVFETSAMYAGYFPHPRPVDEVIELVGLEHQRNSRVVKLSGGQQLRIDVAIALAGDPEVLFLDEPTTGFDPTARHEAWEVVKNPGRFPLPDGVTPPEELGVRRTEVRLGGRVIHQSTFYVASMTAFAVITACYNNIAIGLAVQRDEGVLKRTRGTPLPRSPMPTRPRRSSTRRFFRCCSCRASSSRSGTTPRRGSPGLPRVFPVKHFADGIQAGFLGTTFAWSDVLVVGVWGLGALLLTLRFFSWEPRS